MNLDAAQTTVVDTAAAHLKAPGGDAQRLFHGRGHCYEGIEHLTVDWYPPFLLISVFRRDVDQTWLDTLAKALAEVVPAVTGIALQRRDGRNTRAEILRGEVPEEWVIHEAGMHYLVHPLTHQNIGFFLDMEPARRWVSARAADCKVLNLFAFTCAFSVVAIAGGARQVVNNDMNRSVLNRGEENHRLNGHDERAVRYVPHNLFKSWRKLKQLGRYDLIVVDPPTNQRGSFVAEKDYPGVMKRLPDLAAPGANVLLCLNSPFLPFHFLEDQMARRCPGYRFIERIQPSPDFPDQHPDRGLKLAVFRAPN